MHSQRKRRSARYQDEFYTPEGITENAGTFEEDEDWAEYSFVPSSNYNPMDDPYFEEEQFTQGSHYYKNDINYSDVEPKSSNKIWLMIAMFSLLALAGMVFFVYNAYKGRDEFNKKLKYMDRNTIFNGIYIDGQDIGGMTKENAYNLIARNTQSHTKNLQLTVNIDGQTWLIKDKDLVFSTDAKGLIDRAFVIGRQGFVWNKENGKTPFETRWLHTQQTLKDKAYLTSTAAFDENDIRRISRQIAEQVNKEPVNAVIASFDYNTKRFTVTQDVQGAYIDEASIYQALFDNINKNNFKAQINLSSTPVLPKVSSVELQNNFAMLSSFSTKTNNNNNRNVNISLAAQAINGTSLMPGETFSFNRTTGERTAQKGYMPAPAIAGGISQDETGGGVCQVSSTLFNAAALADMTIINRSPHPWPANYIDKGLDATVNWPNLDFSFRNDKNTPIFVISYYKNKEIYVEIFGMQSAAGESIKLETELVKITKAPKEPKYVQNTAMPQGYRQQLKKARDGYTVDTYRVFLRNGVEYRREFLCTSNYRAVQEEIEYN
ncbi:MAG: VanW family protein [Eubacteriales bacterium]|nr:VanW family protein [Eubacteriales bacterium]